MGGRVEISGSQLRVGIRRLRRRLAPSVAMAAGALLDGALHRSLARLATPSLRTSLTTRAGRTGEALESRDRV